MASTFLFHCTMRREEWWARSGSNLNSSQGKPNPASLRKKAIAVEMETHIPSKAKLYEHAE